MQNSSHDVRRSALWPWYSACAAAPALAAPPGTLPFGAYDPGGDFADDPVPVIEHLFLPWEDVFLPSLNDADAYALARNRALADHHRTLDLDAERAQHATGPAGGYLQRRL